MAHSGAKPGRIAGTPGVTNSARRGNSRRRPAFRRLIGKLIALGNPFFQIESLYRFNAKFFPRREPRFLVYQGALGLPRAGIAALWAEDQLPKPRIGRPSVAR